MSKCGLKQIQGCSFKRGRRTEEVSSSSCRKCSFFFLVSASMCSLKSFSFSSRSSREADSQRWSFLKFRRVSDHVASEDRTWREQRQKPENHTLEYKKAAKVQPKVHVHERRILQSNDVCSLDIRCLCFKLTQDTLTFRDQGKTGASEQ